MGGFAPRKQSTRGSAAVRSKKAQPEPTRKAKGRKDKESNDEASSIDESEASGDEYEAPVSDDEPLEELDSDALDEDGDDVPALKGKRKRASPSKAQASKAKSRKGASPTKKKRKARADSEEDEELELAEGQEVVGRVVKAPTEGRVPPGRISQNTFDFLLQLRKPECNDREWFKLHEPVFRLAEQEWKAFIEVFTDDLAEIDSQIPPLPPKDVIHRIYRDVRFSNDKTPYKTGFSASFSRSGPKGIFAHYHVSIKPGNQSIIAAGSWCPGKNELATIRSNILRSPARLRRVLADKEFVSFFGEPKPHPKGERQSIFGMDDQLKTAPKGVDKNHEDIDLLKCRTFAVVHRFTDAEVLDPAFKEALGKVATVMRPFVHCLNDMMTLAPDDEDDDDEEAAGEEGSAGGDDDD